jgi:hypothetical protein
LLYGWSRSIAYPSNWLDLLVLGAIPTLAILILASPILLTMRELELVLRRLYRSLKLV